MIYILLWLLAFSLSLIIILFLFWTRPLKRTSSPGAPQWRAGAPHCSRGQRLMARTGGAGREPRSDSARRPPRLIASRAGVASRSASSDDGYAFHSVCQLLATTAPLEASTISQHQSGGSDSRRVCAVSRAVSNLTISPSSPT